jgi:hypothetical protein
MTDTPISPGKRFPWLRVLTRTVSMIVNAIFLFLFMAAIAIGDKPQPAALAVLFLMALALLGSVAAWRWEKVGGIFVMGTAVCLGVAAFISAHYFGVASHSYLYVLIYSLPFLLVGFMFWMCSKIAR